MNFLNENIINQLREVFKRLNNEIKIINFISDQNEKSKELKNFLNEFSEVSNKILIENVDTNDSRYEEYKIDKLPAMAFVDSDGNFTGGKFHGIPGGHEINSFVITLLNLGKAGRDFDNDIKERIDSINKEIDLKVFVTLACHHCPDIVADTQQMAIRNPNIKAQMIDISLFPELAEENGIKSVPTIVYNNSEITIGAKTTNEILDKIQGLTN
jgi:thioredoxin reductase (NADPH)